MPVLISHCHQPVGLVRHGNVRKPLRIGGGVMQRICIVIERGNLHILEGLAGGMAEGEYFRLLVAEFPGQTNIGQLNERL